METALTRLSKINSVETFKDWYLVGEEYDNLVTDIQEVVALATAKPQPKIDAMRFEIANKALAGMLSNSKHYPTSMLTTYIYEAVAAADLLILNLVKTNP